MATNPHIYVSNVVGTNTGASDTSKAAQQTGNITSMTASDVYDNLGSAVAGANPSDGDTIYVVDNHAAAHNNGASITFNSSGSLTGSGLVIVSVDNANIENYKPGASEELNDTQDDFLLANNGLIAGLTLKTADNVLYQSSADTEWLLQDTTLNMSISTGDAGFQITSDSMAHLINTTINASGAGNNPLTVGGSSVLHWDGGGLTGTTTTGDLATLAQSGVIYFNGVDLSTHSGTLLTGPSSTANNVLFRLKHCKLNASVTLHGTLISRRHRFEMFNCDDGTDYHRFYIADGTGSAKNNDATYVTAGDSWYEGSVNSSVEVTTTSLCSHVYPFSFTLLSQYVDLSSAASDKLTIEITTDQTLTDTDIAAFLYYPDGTTAVQANWVTSGKTVGTGNYGVDPLAAGTTLTTSALGAGDWTGEPTSPNFYVLELDTSGDAGQSGVVDIRIEVYKPSIAAGELFIHPLLTLS